MPFKYISMHCGPKKMHSKNVKSEYLLGFSQINSSWEEIRYQRSRPDFCQNHLFGMHFAGGSFSFVKTAPICKNTQVHRGADGAYVVSKLCQILWFQIAKSSPFMRYTNSTKLYKTTIIFFFKIDRGREQKDQSIHVLIIHVSKYVRLYHWKRKLSILCNFTHAAHATRSLKSPFFRGNRGSYVGLD